MTGYARVIDECEDFKLKIEIKSVNNKNLNLNIRNPYILNFMDNIIRTEIYSKIFRGSVDVRIEFEDKRETIIEPDYNKNAAQNYMAVLEKLEKDFNEKISNKLSYLVKDPDVIKRTSVELDEDIAIKYVLGHLKNAVELLLEAREREGNNLKEYLKERLNEIEKRVIEIKNMKEIVVKMYMEKMEIRLNGLNTGIEITKEELLKEMMLFADKCDISEEISRLESHIPHFRQEMNKKGESIGKKLDFIIQEMFREINTTGVKANYFDISKLVVECKNELEKIREQLANIE